MSDEAERIWDLMERNPLCTLATWDGSELRSRPMTAFVRRRNEAIYLLADVHTHTDSAIRTYPAVCLTFAAPANQQIVSVTGSAQMSADRTAIRELWATPARQTWDTADNPNIRMLRITPRQAHLWDGTSMRIVPMGIYPAGRTPKNGTTATA